MLYTPYMQYIHTTLTSLVATTALEAVLSMIAKAVDEKTFMMICIIYCWMFCLMKLDINYDDDPEQKLW